MANNNHNPLSSILKSLRIVQGQNQKHLVLEELNNIVLSVLDEKTRKHCVVAGLKGNTLHLTATSPAWQHNVRFFQFEILTKLQKFASFRNITEIKTRVGTILAEDLIRKTNCTLSKPSINHDNAQTLNDVADSVYTSSKKLSHALKSLAAKALKSPIDC